MSERIDTKTLADELQRLSECCECQDWTHEAATMQQAAARLRELEAEVERLGDCERIAWAMTREIRLEEKAPFMCIKYSDFDLSKKEWELCAGNGRFIDLGTEYAPILTDVARAIIDAAMKEGE